jgi:hypothetical protein
MLLIIFQIIISYLITIIKEEINRIDIKCIEKIQIIHNYKSIVILISMILHIDIVMIKMAI